MTKGGGSVLVEENGIEEARLRMKFVRVVFLKQVADDLIEKVRVPRGSILGRKHQLQR